MFPNSWSLKLKIITTSSFLIGILAISLIWQGLSSLEKNIDTTLNDNVDRTGKLVTQYLGSWMNDRVTSIEKTAEKIAQNPDVPPYVLLEQTKQSVGFLITYFGTIDGEMLQNNPLAKIENYDPRVRGWYKGAAQSKRLFISDPYLSVADQQFVVTVAYPVIRDGEFIGVVGGNLSLDMLTQTASSINVPGEGFALLIDHSGIMIAHPEKEWLHKNASEYSSSISPSELNKLVQSEAISEAIINGQEKLIYGASIPKTQWVFLLVMDKSVISEPLTEQFYLQFLIGIFAIVLAIVILSVLLNFLLSELDKIRLSLNEIANGHGDLTKRLPVNSDDEVGQLATSFNQFIEKMQGIISRLNNTSTSLLKEAKEAADSADRQYSQLQLHQSELHMVATAVTEMASVTQEISNNAESTSLAAQETVSLSKQGRIQVEQSQHSIANLASEVSSASKIIDELNEHAQNITSILATISSIADQTNLLALNAAIEAARAGENGRGFAVVADEVRVLSRRTHDSTKEIDSMIIQLQNATSRAVSTMHKGGGIANQSVNDAQAATAILAKITSSIEAINDMSAQIATAAEEQASVTLEINNNTETIKEVGDNMSRSSELSRNSALALKKLGEDINAEVSQFTL